MIEIQMCHFLYAEQYYVLVYSFWITFVGKMITWKIDLNIPKSKRKRGKRQSAIPPKKHKTLKIHKNTILKIQLRNLSCFLKESRFLLSKSLVLIFNKKKGVKKWETRTISCNRWAFLLPMGPSTRTWITFKRFVFSN